MSLKISAFGVAEFTIPSGAKLAANSKSPAQIYVLSGAGGVNPNQPPSYSLFKALNTDEDYSSAAFSAATIVRIEAGASDVMYNYGVDAVVTERRSFQGTPGTVPVLNATGALTAAMILFGLLTSTTAAAVTGTLPTGTVLDAAVQMAVGESVDWSVINTGAANAFTVAAAAGHTVVGNMAVALSSTGRFRTVKTAAATYVTYRIS